MNRKKEQQVALLRQSMKADRVPVSKKETQVLVEFLLLPKNTERHGGELAVDGKTGLNKSSIHTLLNNLELKGLLTSRLEMLEIKDTFASAPRRHYKLSDFGASFISIN